MKVTLELQPAGVRRNRIELKGVEIGWKQEEDLSGVISVLLVAGGWAPGFVPSPDVSLGWGGGGGRREAPPAQGGAPRTHAARTQKKHPVSVMMLEG